MSTENRPPKRRLSIERLSAPTIRHSGLWLGAVIVGIAAVSYAGIVSTVQGWFSAILAAHPYWSAASTPILFVLGAFAVHRFAPEARGSGIPQVLEARDLGEAASPENAPWTTPLVSLRTAGVKVISSALGILGGASIGREGPTVQIAASTFAWVGRITRRFAPVDFSTFVSVGAAAGVGAAFNTPLAGITFAIEEIAEGAFGAFRQPMILAVIISGITAQALVGDSLYLGHVAIPKPDLHVTYQALVIGLVAGVLGGGFARVLAYPRLSRLPTHWMQRAFLCGAGCAVIALLTNGITAGSGYEITTATLDGYTTGLPVLFPVLKLGTTLLSYLSGMAGGIFSPSLSIGAGVGFSIAKLASFSNAPACALIGMVAFFSATVQAPLTAVVIVTEMTDQHILIIPFLAAAFIGQAIGRRFLRVPLYRFLADRKVEG